MKRRKLVAANWKMNLTIPQGEQLIRELLAGIPAEIACDIVIAPPFVHIPMVVSATSDTVVMSAAQNCHFESSGAYTGEVSVDMLNTAGVRYVLTGHSERRQLFQETNEIVRKKVMAILHGGLSPVFCCGESLEVRQSGEQNMFVERQLAESLFNLSEEDFRRVVIAYEPIWAIGTGVNATAAQAQDMHHFIRRTVSDLYGQEVGDRLRILYGGSMKADNAAELFHQPDVDGGLVGGASLQASTFLAIIEAACG